MKAAVDNPTYSRDDDWSIPATNADGASNRLISHGVVLKNGDVLPEYWVYTTDEDPAEDGKDAIKQELLNGRGVPIMYHADQGGTYSVAPGKSANGNTSQNQYVYEAEAMEFSANLGTEGRFATLQYDCMPAASGFYAMPASGDVASSANVFSADDADVAVKSVSTRTSEANTRVTFAIYRLNDGAEDPTDGKMLYRTSQNVVAAGGRVNGVKYAPLHKTVTLTVRVK